MSNGDRRGDHIGLGRQGSVSRRPIQWQRSTMRSCSPSASSLAARQISRSRPAACDHQRHAGRRHHSAREHQFRAHRCERRRLPVGCAAGLLFHDADAGRLRRWAVRADDQFAAADHAGEAAAIRPRIIHVETVRPGDTVQSLASRMAYRDFKLDRFLSLNGLSGEQHSVAGAEGQSSSFTGRGGPERTANSVACRCSSCRQDCPTCRRRRRQAAACRRSSQRR